ncbi:hypothetical protein BDY24DRAFT_211043 [Mrakia frigida]|uniref:HCNGP domain-containing protein n=1 Tax=Mrakia frigida TaxID=29902 RepID=UPI003FCC1AB4
MQGLLSYSDDEEDEDRQPQVPTSSSTSFLSVPTPPTDRSSSSSKPRPSPPPPPSHRPPTQPGAPPRPSSKPLLPPNIVRKAPSNNATASTSTSTYPSSPLRQPYITASTSSRSDSPPPPVPFPPRDAGNDSTFNRLSEEDQLKELLKPPRLRSGDGWEEEYGLKRLGDPDMLGEVDEALQTKTTFFLSLKKKGTHFNDSLMKNKAFRNPTIYKKLVDHVGVDERAGRYGGVWEWGREEGDEEWGVERIADLQKSRSSSSSSNAPPAPGSRSSIAFSSSSSSSSTHQSSNSTSSGFPPNPLLSHSRADKQASLRDALASRSSASSAAGGGRGVVSGGKEYGFVGLPGGDEVGKGSGSGKRDRGDRDRDGKHGGKGEGKVSRWG